MSTIKINELATTDIALTDFIAKADANGLMTKNTVSNLSKIFETVGEVGFKGSVLIADDPTEDGWYLAGEAGTFPNIGGLVALSESVTIFVISDSDTTYSKIDIPLTLPFDSVPTLGSTNAVESGGVLLNKSGKMPIFYNASKYLNFNSVSQQLEIPGATRVFIGNKFYYVRGDDSGLSTQRNIDLSLLANGIILIDIDESQGFANKLSYRVVSHEATDIGDNEVIVGYYGNYGEFGYVNGKFELNGFLQEQAGNVALIYNETELPNFNTIDKTFTVPAQSRIVCGKRNDTYISSAISLDLTSVENGFIYYNLITNVFSTKVYNQSSELEPHEIYICSYSNWGASTVSMVGSFTVNSNKKDQNGLVPFFYNGLGVVPNFNTTDKIFTVAKSSRLRFGTTSVILKGDDGSTSATPKNVDYSAHLNGVILFNTILEEYRVVSHSESSYLDEEIIIATYSNYGINNIDFKGNYTVNSKDITVKGADVNDILSPNYTIHDISSITDIWSDMVIINEELWLFKYSTEEEHVLMNGEIYIIDLSNFSLIRTINHNLGHCNTVHYDDVNDILCIGNLPGNTSYPAAVYMIYDISSHRNWDEIDFTSTSVDKTIIDVSGINVAMAQTVGCFGEGNNGKRNILYVNGSFNKFWAKIILGYGSNNLGEGNFTSTTSDKFNGSFKTLNTYDFTNDFDNETEVTQGIDYVDGKVITSNGHDNLRGAIWNVNNIGRIKRTQILTHFYNDLGVQEEFFTEGLCSYNGGFLHGIIDTDNAKRYLVEYKL
jgi:hypothetical protein